MAVSAGVAFTINNITKLSCTGTSTDTELEMEVTVDIASPAAATGHHQWRCQLV